MTVVGYGLIGVITGGVIYFGSEFAAAVAEFFGDVAESTVEDDYDRYQQEKHR